MKTFDEAFKTVVSTVAEKDVTPELLDKLHDYQLDRAHKYRALGKEVRSHEVLIGMLEGICHEELCSNVERCECIMDAALKVFTLGLQVGMEMEKQEMTGL